MRHTHPVEINGEEWIIGEATPSDVRDIMFSEEFNLALPEEDRININSFNMLATDLVEDGMDGAFLCQVTQRKIKDIEALTDRDLDKLAECVRLLNRRFLATKVRTMTRVAQMENTSND